MLRLRLRGLTLTLEQAGVRSGGHPELGETILLPLQRLTELLAHLFFHPLKRYFLLAEVLQQGDQLLGGWRGRRPCGWSR